jgi:hypothetical protein
MWLVMNMTDQTVYATSRPELDFRTSLDVGSEEGGDFGSSLGEMWGEEELLYLSAGDSFSPSLAIGGKKSGGFGSLLGEEHGEWSERCTRGMERGPEGSGLDSIRHQEDEGLRWRAD